MNRRKFKDSIIGLDPFDISERPTPLQIKWGIWFRDLVVDIPTFHLRRIHYMALGKLKPNGKAYENTINDSTLLTNAALYARYLGFVDQERFRDHKNSGVVNTTEYEKDEINLDTVLCSSISEAHKLDNLQDLLIYDEQVSINLNVQSRQPYHLEIWIEKSTMNDILIPISKKYGIELVVASGQFSLTLVNELYNRLKYINKPTRIFYLRDFDPAGASMSIAMSRKLEWFIIKDEIKMDVKVIDMGLNRKQCEKYNLPRTPMKDKTSIYKNNFELKYGEGATELDALESLHPGKLKLLVERFVKKYYDPKIKDELENFEHNMHDRMDSMKKNNIDDIVSSRKDDLSIIFEKYNKSIEEIDNLRQNIVDIIEESGNNNSQINFDRDTIPKSDYAVDEMKIINVVFNTDLPYILQLDEYRKRQRLTVPERIKQQLKRQKYSKSI